MKWTHTHTHTSTALCARLTAGVKNVIIWLLQLGLAWVFGKLHVNSTRCFLTCVRQRQRQCCAAQRTEIATKRAPPHVCAAPACGARCGARLAPHRTADDTRNALLCEIWIVCVCAFVQVRHAHEHSRARTTMGKCDALRRRRHRQRKVLHSCPNNRVSLICAWVWVYVCVCGRNISNVKSSKYSVYSILKTGVRI